MYALSHALKYVWHSVVSAVPYGLNLCPVRKPFRSAMDSFANANNSNNDDETHDESVFQGCFNPIVTSSRVWTNPNQAGNRHHPHQITSITSTESSTAST